MAAIVTAAEITRMGWIYSKNTHVQIDRLIFASYGMHAMNYFASLGIFYAWEMQDAEETKSLWYGESLHVSDEVSERVNLSSCIKNSRSLRFMVKNNSPWIFTSIIYKTFYHGGGTLLIAEPSLFIATLSRNALNDWYGEKDSMWSMKWVSNREWKSEYTILY